MAQLALLGGEPVRRRLYPAYRPIGEEEKRAALEVLESGYLSGFLGSWDPVRFYGGPRVRALEQAWADLYGARHAISVNSATSGLYAAIGAAGIGPGDEVIVSPYTMTASATCVLIYNGIPVFADIEEDTFCLDAASIRRHVTPRTKAIVVVHLFGHAADMDSIMEIAREHNLTVIEDSAQAPLATYQGRPVGTIGHMGVFSLNYHKHIHTGEGGVVTTNDDRLAERLCLIRNHGEAVVAPKGVTEIAHTFGFNFRMTEIEAAIGLAQLQRVEGLVAQRIANAEHLARRLGSLPGITPPTIRPGCRHVYYMQAFRFDAGRIGVSRDTFIKAVAAELPAVETQEDEGPLLYAGYVEPLYLQPMYQRQLAYGESGCPFRCPLYHGRVNYEKGLCPVAERMHYEELFAHEYMRPPATTEDLEDVVRAFEKVYEHRPALAEWERKREGQDAVAAAHRSRFQ